MSEIKFSCPNCQQVISATPEYSGTEIACPACQTPMVVPGVPPAPAAGAGKLHVAASGPAHTPATFVAQAPPVRRKKKHTQLWVGLGVTAGVIVLAVVFGPWLLGLFHHHEEAVAAAQAATNAPPAPPPPPVLSTEEILQKVSDTYGAMPSYLVRGQSVAALDVSGLNPAERGIQNFTSKVALAMARSGLYRVEWERPVDNRVFGGAAWSFGKGDFVAYPPNPAAKTRSRAAALSLAANASGTECEYLPAIFFNDTNSLTRQADAFAKTNGTALNGEDCYILAGEFKAHDVILWIDKKTFLIPQIQFVYGGKLEDADLKDLSIARKNQLTTWSKIKGTVTEKYDKPATNSMLTVADFSQPLMTRDGQAPPMRDAAASSRRPPQHATASSATSLTRRVREQNDAEQRALSQ